MGCQTATVPQDSSNENNDGGEQNNKSRAYMTLAGIGALGAGAVYISKKRS